MSSSEIVVVTGASAGVGRAVAREFSRRGASLALIARDPDRLKQACGEVEKNGGRCLAISADVADAGRILAAADEVEQTLGPIDVWVNCAMATIFARFEDLAPEDYRRATEVTYLGSVYGTMAALRHMRKRDKGVIVQVGSALAYRAIPLQAVYCGAKFAIRGFTDAVRTELLHDKSGIHITMVQLPAVNTPQFSWCKCELEHAPRPVAPVFQPEVIAEAIYKASRLRRREMAVGISSAAIIALNKFMPSLLDRYLAKTAVKGQQTPEKISPVRKDNLYRTVSADYGAHGEFDSEAYGTSVQLWASLNRSKIALAGLTAAAFLGGYWLLRKEGRSGGYRKFVPSQSARTRSQECAAIEPGPDAGMNAGASQAVKK